MDKWISTSKRLPEPEKEVLALCRTRGGVDYLCIAIYVAPWTPREDSTIIWNYEACEYDKELDEYFVVPGWYEMIKNWDEYRCVEIVDDVTHWIELPETQKEENDGRC